MLPIAVDALGGDKAPGEIIAGAREAVAAGIDVILVGPRGLAGCEGFELIEASEVIEMHEDAASSVRNKKDSTLVRAAAAGGAVPPIVRRPHEACGHYLHPQGALRRWENHAHQAACCGTAAGKR